jgi:ABC-type multidrug transport system ATPase subunit
LVYSGAVVGNEVVYPEFDEMLQTDILNKLCVDHDEPTGNNRQAKRFPIFCKTLSDNFTGLAQPATLFVNISGDGDDEEDKIFQWYPTPEDEACRSVPANQTTIEFCTLEDLVVIPTSSFQNASSSSSGDDSDQQQDPKALETNRTPMPSMEVASSFIQKVLGDSGGSPFQQGMSLATTSCGSKCNAGYQCTPVLDYALAIASLGQCERCDLGSFCPAGTLHDGGLAVGNARLNLCPAGYFCPTPKEAYTCPAGYFCPSGSHKPFSCKDISITALELKGNYCPENSGTPFGLCPKGYYCPSPEMALLCPEGYYCKVQSLEPDQCPFLSACPLGSSMPNISWITLISISSLFVGIAIFLLAVALWIRLSQRNTLKEAKESAKHASLLKAIGVKLGLCADQMSYASNLKGFSKNIMLVDILVNHFSVQVRKQGKKKMVLNRVYIKIRASTLNIILGSSGAGKSTFLKALVGKFSSNSWPSGEISFDFKNHPLKVNLVNKPRNAAWCSGSLTKLRARETAVKLGVGYVAQDNIVHEILTVHENIAYSAKLRLGSDMSTATKNIIIQDTITILGLNHIQNAKVGNPLSASGSISGGEARRVSIGLELVACPNVIILDEPTSGLDAVAANDVMTSLSKMSDLGVTVIASLHQPRYATFLLFDSVHLFMRGGYVVYSGPTTSALDYFTKIGFRLPSKENPADFMLDVISGLIELPGNKDFTPLDLIGFKDGVNINNTEDLLSSRRVRSSNEFPFGVSSEEYWPSKDDACLSSRIQPVRCQSEATLQQNLFTTVELRDSVEEEAKSLEVMPTPRWLETLGEQFDQLDSKREGFIDNENMLQLLESMGQKCTLEDAKKIVKHFDVDGDGKIERKDFLLRWTKNYWTREFSSALLGGLFPGIGGPNVWENEEVDENSGLVPESNCINSLATAAATVEMGQLQSQRRAASGGGGVSSRSRRTFSRESSKIEILEIFTSRSVFLRSANSFFCQLLLLLQREPLKMMRTLELRVLDFGSVAIIGVGNGFVKRGGIETDLDSIRASANVALLFVGVLSSLWATVLISKELPMAQREASEGISVSAIFISLNLFNAAVELLIRSLAYGLPFFYITGFNMAFGDFFLILFGSAWCTSGIGMLVSCVAQSRSAVVLSVAVTFLFGAVLNGVVPSLRELKDSSNPLLYWMVLPSYSTWATEALTTREEAANESYQFAEKVQARLYDYDPANWLNAVLFLYLSGMALRAIAFAFFYRRAME